MISSFIPVIICVGLGVLATDRAQCHPPTKLGMDSPTDNRKEKRRTLNVQAAKKSYESKKKERSDLQQKNTELQETQMKLLHDKCHLEQTTKRFEQILSKMTHSCKDSLRSSSVYPPSDRVGIAYPNVRFGTNEMHCPSWQPHLGARDNGIKFTISQSHYNQTQKDTDRPSLRMQIGKSENDVKSDRRRVETDSDSDDDYKVLDLSTNTIRRDKPPSVDTNSALRDTLRCEIAHPVELVNSGKPLPGVIAKSEIPPTIDSARREEFPPVEVPCSDNKRAGSPKNEHANESHHVGNEHTSTESHRDDDVLMKGQYEDEDILMDTSTLDLGATQEVEPYVAPAPRRGRSRSVRLKSEHEDDEIAFVPPPRAKRSKKDGPRTSVERISTGCGKAALLKQQGLRRNRLSI